MKRYIAGLAALLMLGIYGCSGGGGTTVSSVNQNDVVSQQKASVTFKVDFAPGLSDIQSAALQSDITRVEIYYKAGCSLALGHTNEQDWFESDFWLYNCSKGGMVVLTTLLNTATINDIPIGIAEFRAKIMKDNVTVVDEVVAQGKLTSGTNKIYLPVLRGTWQLDTPINLSLVNNLANSGISGISDNLSFNISQLTAMQLLGRYERLDNTTLKYCEFYDYYNYYNYPANASSLQFDNKTPFYAYRYGGSYYDNISQIGYGCGVPGLNYEFNGNNYLYYNNIMYYYYYYNEAFDGWFTQTLQFNGGTTNANLVDVGLEKVEENLLGNGSYFTQGVGLSTLSRDPFLTEPDYRSLTYYDYTTGKLAGYFVEHAQTGVYECSILEKIWDNTTYQYYNGIKYDLSSCNVFPPVNAQSVKKSNKRIMSAFVNKALTKSIKKSSFVSDGTIQSFSLSDSMELYWNYFCYDNTTKKAYEIYYDQSCNTGETKIFGQFQATGSLTGKYRVVPFTATKQSTFNPAGYVAGAQIVDWIWKGAKPTLPQ